MIGIIDYGLGNLTSVAGAVEKVGFEPVVTAELDELEKAEKLILPGVGAFGDGMRNLRERNLIRPLTEMVVRRGKPVLGICLGFQLIAQSSEEFGLHDGLGWISGRVVRMAPGDDTLRVPHVGWNELFQVRDCVLFEDVPPDALFYHVHSFRLAADDPEIVVGESDYGGRFTSVVQRRNVFATQFHPEKSQRHGLTLLRNFLERT